MTQLLNTNDRKVLMKVAKFVHLGMKEYTSLPDVSEIIDTSTADLSCIPSYDSKQIIPFIILTHISLWVYRVCMFL